MTTIVGIQGAGFAVVCGDSRISDITEVGATQVVTLNESSGKIAANGKYLIGVAGDVRAINILHHVFKPPKIDPHVKGKKLDHFFTAQFVPALRSCFDEHGYSSPQNDATEHMSEQGSSIIVVVNATIYTVEFDYSWYSDVHGIYALGTGAQYAMGALHALTGKMAVDLATAKKFAIKALAAAAKFDPFTGAPYSTHVQGQDIPRNTKNKKAK
jgi:ATP-dependent protease HslVU (ClpYQ) peptidase subunit